MTIDPLILLGLVAFSVTITLVTNWIVSGFRWPALPRRFSASDVVTVIANLIWILLIFAAGILAARYVERIRSAATGYLVFGLGALLLSLVRGFLYRRLQQQQKPRTRRDKQPRLQYVMHHSTYVLFATVLYLSVSWLLDRAVAPILFIPLWIGALLPDLDSQSSVLGRLLPFVSQRLEARVGHRQRWHSLAANAFVALITAPLIPLIGLQAWFLNLLGFLSHLVLDVLAPEGIPLLWPATDNRYLIDSPGEHRLTAALAIVGAILFLVVDIGQLQPPPVPAPSYEQTVERYYELRGRNLVFAYVEGTWQLTGRRMSGRFEILNAAGESFTMLDRYDGKVFTAGRGTVDNLYLNRITLQTGSPVRIKPAEIHLQDQLLAERLPVLYQMQREPGLQHIYVSGDVVIPVVPDGHSPTTVQVDHAQTSLPRIQAHAPEHYSFHYLSASEFIELANLRVKTADLVIVATYASPATGPTVTPLPSPLPTPEPVQ